MFWQEDNSKDKSQIPGDILDVSFKIECKALPVSHAHLLSQALVKALPWLETESKAAIHQVYLPEAGNGWMRSSDPNEVIYLSGRSKLILRVPKEKLEDTHRLSGETLDLGAFKIKVGKGKEKPLSVTTTLTCRYIESDPQEAEDVFLKRVIGELRAKPMGITKALCGKSHELHLPQGVLYTRSLMLADLTIGDAVRLQQDGYGAYRLLGCGIFMPSKSITAVNKED